ncbi:MAG: hypothetical protein A4E49_02702 [Methanosaeta sp. PtaU1.Bin112]|nr:MAG: hypothetical protein A4E49_02702 [Methanosaeta sp. PtaU1.Bin112]
MGGFVRGDVVVVPFPFSDLTEAKRRPAFVLAELDGDDRILCQITSQQFADRYAVTINESEIDFICESGSNQVPIFTGSTMDRSVAIAERAAR